MAQVKAIDIWVNPFTPEFMKRLLAWDEVGEVARWWHMEERYKGHSPEEFAEILDKVGVEKVFIPSLKMWSFKNKRMGVEYSVKEIYDLINKRPDKFAGLYGINPYTRMQGVRELESAVKDYGFIGAHLHTYGFGLPVNHRDYYPFYAKCVELGVPVVMQIGHSAEAMPSEMGRPIHIDDFALYFPELNIVATHTGWPWTEELIALAWKHPNVYIGTSAHAPRYWDKSLVNFANTRGKGKVLWGTDYAVVTHEEGITQIEQLGLKEDAKAQLLREAAVKVFKLRK